MTHDDLIDEIEALGFPCTYGSFKSAPSIPFTVVVESNDNDFKADNKNYSKIRGYDLEYYNSSKYPPDEKKIEDKLDELGLTYSKYCTKIEKEGLYETIFSVQLI